MVFHCRCFSFDEEEHIEYEIESQTQTKSTSTQTYYTASSAFSNMAGKPNDLRIFTHTEMKTATNNFCSESNIGEGRHGSVYKGLVKSLEHPFDKIEVVVKYAKGVKKEHKEWLAEVNFLGVIEHPDLVKLVGYCVENHERGMQLLLVYEYMPNKSVKDHLSIGSEPPLSWTVRLKVARDAARGLSYLHEGMDFQILFRDFNSSRLLLDDQWNAKLSDLMVARIVSQEGDIDEFVGSVAYAAPEYILTGQVSSKSDVWSYGVFLYELITGRHPLDRNRPQKEQNLLEWVRPYVHSENLQPIIDPRLKGMCSLKSVEALTIIAELCLKRDRKSRPKMSEVLERVNGVIWVSSHFSTYVPVYESSMPVIRRPKPLKFWFRKVCCCACIESGK